MWRIELAEDEEERVAPRGGRTHHLHHTHLREPMPMDAATPDQSPAEADADFVPLSGEGAADGPELEPIDPFQWDSLQARHAFDQALAAAGEGNIPRAMQTYIRAAKTAETAHEWYLAAVASREVGDYLLAEGPQRDVERAFRMYRRAVAAYERCGLVAEARELSYYEMRQRLRWAPTLGLSVTHRIELFLFWVTAGFGYRPLRVLATATAIILGYALAYALTGGVIRSSDGTLVRRLTEMIYFSGITFSTVGYGDYMPQPHQHFLALSEGALGIALLGFFVAVLANRLSRG